MLRSLVGSEMCIRDRYNQPINEPPTNQPEWEPANNQGQASREKKSISFSIELPSAKIFALIHLVLVVLAYTLLISSTTKYGGYGSVVGDGSTEQGNDITLATFIGTLETAGMIITASSAILVLLDVNELPTMYLSVFSIALLYYTFVSVAHGIKVLPDNNKLVKATCAFLGMAFFSQGGLLYAQHQLRNQE
eukprot:TRINITY_DN855_c0_g1_i4.p1 TRINITY_DN855_c0_g1~~TRINITY_DN855_c0_g1_i4.p1  ORF type:complete len:192 (+),score=77.29 TRINITY_DN855_c0_g1_i4:122-697(+)